MRTVTRWLICLVAGLFAAGAFADTVIILNDPARSVAVGSPGGQVVVLVKNDAGNMAAGANYRFATDPACGAFFVEGYPSVIDGVTDSNGALTSPAFFGVAQSVSCPWTLAIDNVPGLFDFSMHVFSYPAIVMTPHPASITSQTDWGFGIEFSLSEGGLPIVAQTAGTFAISDVTPNRNGASATLIGPTYMNADVIGTIFQANSKQGDYSITFSLCCGAPPVTVQVSQRHK